MANDNPTKRNLTFEDLANAKIVLEDATKRAIDADELLKDQDINDALKSVFNNDLKSQEWKMIQAWAMEPEPNAKQAMFDNLIEHVSSIKVHELEPDDMEHLDPDPAIAKEQMARIKDAWSTHKNKMIEDIQSLQDAKTNADAAVKNCQDEINKLMKDFTKIQNPTKEQVDTFQKEYTSLYDSLEARLKSASDAAIKLQVSTMIGLHAKDKQAQIDAWFRHQAQEERRESVKREFHGIADRAKEIGRAAKREFEIRKELGKAGKELDNVHMDKKKVRGVKDAFARYNDDKQTKRKLEDKLIAKAQKRIDKEYAKEHRFDNIKKILGKGDEINPTPKTVVKDGKEALEHLKDKNNIFMKTTKRHYEKYVEIVDKDKQTLDAKLKDLEQSVFSDRDKVKEIGQELIGRDDIGNTVFTAGRAGKVSQAFGQAFENTQYRFDSDLSEYMKENDFGHMVEGEEITFGGR